jgi:hypothetical protein
MTTTCIPDCSDTIDFNYQSFPKEGKLTQNTDLSLEALKSRIGLDTSFVYCYVVATIKQAGGNFYQTGSGPNFQGDLVTLCTCKRYMRTFLDSESWKGKWIAGFTGQKAGEGKNRLVYLMRVEQTYVSHYGLWHSETIPLKAKNVKLTRWNNLGDVYQPKEEAAENYFNVRNYFPPVETHTHHKNDEWHRDINYSGMKGRRAVLLVGDIQNSFLWSKPLITFVSKLHRGQKKYLLSSLLEYLR